MREESLSNLLSENRIFGPSAEFIAQANVNESAYNEAEVDRIAF